MCCKTFEDSRSGRVQHNMAMNQRLLIRPGFFFTCIWTSGGELSRFSYRKLIKPLSSLPVPFINSFPPAPYIFHPLSLPPPTISLALALTDTARRAGLPVVSIFHLDAGDSALPLQFITWITRKGHRVARLPTFPVATAIHRNAGISAGCSQWTWRANTHKHTR